MSARSPLRLLLIALVLAFLQPLAAEAQDAERRAKQRAERLEQLRKRFPDADANQDGKLTEAEASAYRAKLQARRSQGRRRARVKPTEENVKYGEHSRNVFDLWLPEKKPAEGRLPVFVYFHGGGFVGGDKAGFDPLPYLKEGMAVVSGNYRFVDGRDTLSPAPLRDAARVIQTLRARAGEWNLDPKRIAVSGNSAGAVISLWIGYHDDLADPSSKDVVAQQSSRVRCIVPLNGPTNLDPRWITPNMGGPKHIHGSYPKMFGAPAAESDQPEVRKRILESSPIEHVSQDDPPTLLIYGGKNQDIPLPESASTGVLIHHAYFGAALKKSLDAVGVENKLLTGIDPRRDGSKVILKWLKEKL